MGNTRDKLIDIARQLFAHKGIENTTMNDIAIAAEKAVAQSILISKTSATSTML